MADTKVYVTERTTKMNDNQTYSHLYVIKGYKCHLIVSADDMNKETARGIVCQDHPILGRILPVKIIHLG